MNNFLFDNPTRVHFGEKVEFELTNELKMFKKILIIYGSNRIKEQKLLSQIEEFIAINKSEIFYLEGIEPNPKSTKVYEGIKICKEKQIDFLLAIGGGSVIDTAKAIAIGAKVEHDFFDFFEENIQAYEALPLGCVLTIAGAGSETNSGMVITHVEKQKKLTYGSRYLFPKFVIMNPQFTTTVPMRFTSAGIVDAISHVFERYFSNTENTKCLDGMSEGVLRSLFFYGDQLQDGVDNYQLRAELMWASKVAQDNYLGVGKKQDWASHIIGHELSARYDYIHGEVMAVIFIAWLKYNVEELEDKLEQLNRYVFQIDIEDNKSTNMEVISYIENKFKNWKVPTRLSELGFDEIEKFDEIATSCVSLMPSGTIGNFIRLKKADIINIFKIAF